MTASIRSAKRRLIRVLTSAVFACLSCLTCAAASRASADSHLVILPPQVSLSTVAARQRLVVQRRDGEQFQGEVRSGLVWTSSDERVVKIVDGVAVPMGDGEAMVSVRAESLEARVNVQVGGQSAPFVWSFRNHVESVLSKTGCNGGACHGARAGKNGFRLTLFAYDPDSDYSYLTRQANGRRIVPTDPGRSLLLTKPTGVIPHKGGVRFEPDSLEYRVLAEWIAAGAPGPAADDCHLTRLEVFPPHSRQSPGGTQQLVVLGHFSDGHVEDVTRWAKYTSVNSSVAAVNEHGKVDVTGSGEGAVQVWYLNANVMAFLSVPYPATIPAATFADAPRRNFIDDETLAKLASLNVPPSPPVDDATFMRRAYLDTIGVLPSPDETRAFLADTSPEKRDRLVDQLLASPEFVDYWAYKWSDLLLVTGERLRPKAVETYYQWVRGKVAANAPWDEFARELVTATGNTVENGAANFFALHQDPEDMAETTAQAFLGLSINCARCHNHPLEKWTNDQYYGMANLFARVRSKGWGGDFRSGDGVRVVFTEAQGELIQPSKGKPQPPRPLDAEPLEFSDTSDRRDYLARWLTAPENPYFTRTIVNRVWANFFGTGLVEKVDDVRLTNPASNERLLGAACQHLIAHRYYLKELMRAILKSATYQRSSKPLPENLADDRFYSRYYPRRLKAELLLDALSQITDVPTEFKNAENKPFPKGTRALQLPDSSVASYFLKTFGRPERLITCDCERSDEPSMTQVLHIANGNTLNGKLQAPGNRIEQLMTGGASDAVIIEDLYLRALVRFPTPDEVSRLTEVVAAVPADQRRAAIEDLYWSVLSSREFLFNH